jgi:methionyl-tRNA formyltransferase
MFENAEFFQGLEPQINPTIDHEYIHSFNHSDGVESVRQSEPDLIVVFGTDILRGEILDIAKVDMLNIHRDILPEYAGGGLPMWVFYERDFEKLGVTIHKCIAALDRGDIVGQRLYKLVPDDRIWKLRARTTKLSVELLRAVIAAYQKSEVQFQKQPPSTHTYTRTGLTLFKELKARWNFHRYISSLPKDP